MLKIVNVTKLYKKNIGIKNISIDIPCGNICAIVGPNGAGKTTLFSVLAGIEQPDEGFFTFENQEIKKLHSFQIGYLPEHPFPLAHFSPYQTLQYMNEMRKMGMSSQGIHALIQLFDMEEVSHIEAYKLSQGMRKRVQLAVAIMGNPSVLILDEPTNAIDTQTLITLKRVLRQLKNSGSLILISSHVLDFVEDMADCVIFLHKGKIVKKCEPPYKNLESIYLNLDTGL